MSDDLSGPHDLRATQPRDTGKRQVLELTGLIYDAALDPPRWQDFADALSRACGGAATAITLRASDRGRPSHAFLCGLDPEFSGLLNRFISRGLPWDPLHPCFRREFVRASDLLPDEELPATDFHREYMRPQGLAPEAPIAHTIAVSENLPIASVVIFRRLGCRALGRQDLELCNALRPHLDRAYQIHSRLSGERDRHRALAEVINCFPMGVMLLDADGVCLTVNESANRILSMNDGIGLDRKRPHVSDERRNLKLHEAIGATASEAVSKAKDGVSVIAVERPSGGAPFTVMVSPLLAAEEATLLGDPVAVVFIADPNAGSMSQSALQDLYSLTPAEAGLVGLLVTGRSLDDIAALRGIETSTARGYLKQAYRKTRTKGQRELVRLLLTGVGAIAEPHLESAPRGSIEVPPR